jgi:hypothetical protein
VASDVPRFHTVCEGPSDFFVIQGALAEMLNNADFLLERVQPPESLYGGSAGPFGGGWKGVRAWCESMRETWGSVGASRSANKCDLLIIHLDGETADEDGITCSRPSPPAHDTVVELEKVLFQWMGDPSLPDWIVFCIPSKDTDAWVLVALYPDDEWAISDIESRYEPAQRLLNKPEKLVRRREGRIQKLAPRYRAIQDRISSAWPTVKQRCREAENFEENFLAKV